jgi:hypothetical protein
VNSENRKAIRTYIDAFCAAHKEEPRDGRIMMVTSFAVPYGLLGADERITVVEALLKLIDYIKEEKFEDGDDFIQFMLGFASNEESNGN